MKRRIVQFGWMLLTNLHLTGFVRGRIYQGPLKQVCVPGLNCYSCPGALGSCPIGALQAVIGSAKYSVSYYVVGALMLFGLAFGRLVCGFLCPFGLVQELLHKIRVKKMKVAARIDRPLRYLKYAVLLFMVLLMPMFLGNRFGIAPPYFCQFLCPSGTLFGGVPLLIGNPSLRQAAGLLFSWKALVLVFVLAFSALIYRPFCKYLCPLGALYALFNKVSLVRMAVDEGKCTRCAKCARACGMQISMPHKPNHPECVRCGACEKACPEGAITTCVARARQGETLREAAPEDPV